MNRSRASEAINHIVRLRRVERAVEPSLRHDLAAAREYLEALVGPTVRPADAARLLRISHPALSRWIKKDEISTVLTPEGQHGIPVHELIPLLDDVERTGGTSARPVARALRERRRRSEATIDLERLLPRRRERGHRTAELQSLAYHRLVAERLDDQIVEQARRRLTRWRESRRVDSRWLDEWERVLAMPLAAIAKTIGADTVRARELRQTSPFAGVLTEHERRRLARAVEERALA